MGINSIDQPGPSQEKCNNYTGGGRKRGQKSNVEETFPESTLVEVGLLRGDRRAHCLEER